ncbi:FtsK/SpoIIIE N-terminal domain-containing protein [Paenilisteria newyorkensis]|uniref:FtsK/SpoIIIE N-terminal domain-containing protein n=1 Tax=Listeria newyorkensis TaxID=1497681 RepID=UPI0023588B72|nr:FtsK/SpoIIIE N-terminal domain-containing protein [Listeria newyorkensis]WAO20559.1 FtsK/SpoIIIE N-terminal domain-containing protein [Listeria newyorkensis]
MEKQLLTISYGNQLHKCQLDSKKEVTIGGDLNHMAVTVRRQLLCQKIRLS